MVGSMNGMAPPPPSSSSMDNNTGMDAMVITHMTFFWSKNAYILFSGWPGTRTGMYVFALIFIFVLSILVEWLSHCSLTKPGPKHVVAGLIQTVLHALRVGLGFIVMLAVMSFNVGVFFVAVAGHTVGFLLFRSRVFKESEPEKISDLPQPPMSC